MGRTLRDSKLDTREARARLRVQSKPYWRLIQPGLHLGYRRLAKRPGSWCVRRYVGEQRYVVEALDGVADDFQEANGHDALSFGQAQRIALDRKPKTGGPVTVRKAVEDYLEFLAHNRRTAQDARYRLDAFVLPVLGDVPVADLTAERLRKWLYGLAAMPRRVRSPKGKPPSHAKVDGSAEAQRKRRASANRTWAVFRAALNRSWRDGAVRSNDAWTRVEVFKGVQQAGLRFLTADECRRLVNATEGAFRRLVEGALVTGCRYGELCDLVASDFHGDSGTLLICTSKTGRARTVWLTVEAQRLFARWCAGKRGDALLLPRDDGEPWKRAQQGPRMREACARAGITPAIAFHGLRHTAASHLAMKGVPLTVIAEQLGHASIAMTRRYSHLSKSYVSEAIRENALTLGIEPADAAVVPLVRP